MALPLGAERPFAGGRSRRMAADQHQQASRPAGTDRTLDYHRIVLAFARHALGTADLESLLQRTTEEVARGMHIRRAKILSYQPETDDLLVCAGTGWREGVVRHARLPSNMASPPGRTFRTCQPVYIHDLPASSEYEYSDLLREHGIVSLINVPIMVERNIWGVLEVDSERQQRFDSADEEFLCGFAGLLGSAIEKKRRDAADVSAHLERTIELREREALFRELQHRIANNFQSIVGLVDLGARRVTDPAARQEFARLGDRVASILSAHEQLSLDQVESEISLGPYIAELARTIRGPDTVQIVKRIEGATVPLRTAVRLGIILNELATNSLKHAFDAEGGAIRITLSIDRARQLGRMEVADNGRGPGAAPSPGKGTSLVASFAEQIGGSVERASSPGQGTSVAVTFPLDCR
jgi:two-component system, sensor histidine kinase PdtaS